MSKITTEYDPEVNNFVCAMRYKLHVNRHKGRWEGQTLGHLFKKLREEVDELEAEINSGQPNQIAILLEAADVSNVAMMISNVALKKAASLPESLKGIIPERKELPNGNKHLCLDMLHDSHNVD